MNKKTFEIEMKVRDYELDAQGVVNNANYQHYFEHTRHEFLDSLGISFSQCHDEGNDLFVARAELHYKSPLRGGDRFISRLTLERKGVKVVFKQAIFRKSDNVLCCKGEVDTVSVVNGTLTRGEFFDEILKDYLE